MNNHWLKRAAYRAEQEELRQKYTVTRLIDEFPELAERIAADLHGGLGCLTFEERKIAIGGRAMTIMDEIMFQEDCRVMVSIKKACAAVKDSEASPIEKSREYSQQAADNLRSYDGPI